MRQVEKRHPQGFLVPMPGTCKCYPTRGKVFPDVIQLDLERRMLLDGLDRPRMHLECVPRKEAGRFTDRRRKGQEKTGGNRVKGHSQEAPHPQSWDAPGEVWPRQLLSVGNHHRLPVSRTREVKLLWFEARKSMVICKQPWETKPFWFWGLRCCCIKYLKCAVQASEWVTGW